jgi:hypothetical protein
MSTALTLNLDSACIIIASHISNTKRIGHLIECLYSLVKQILPINIYLSISFENETLQKEFAVTYSENPQLQTNFLHMIIRTKKTPQMRHIEQLLTYITNKHHWIMFCDDDDTYHPERTKVILQNVINCVDAVSRMPGKVLKGVYESTFGKEHGEQRHEYWCYCVHISTILDFMKTIRNYDDILEHTCCDVLFGEYLRRLQSDYLFGIVRENLYNYRIENNSDSITGEIQTKNKKIRRPREINESNRLECAVELSLYLDEHIEIYKHDTYLRTLVGMPFDDILRNEFLNEYQILNLIDQKHIDSIRAYHDRLRGICNTIYHNKI